MGHLFSCLCYPVCKFPMTSRTPKTEVWHRELLIAIEQNQAGASELGHDRAGPLTTEWLTVRYAVTPIESLSNWCES
jgi:hypothetical protein